MNRGTSSTRGASRGISSSSAPPDSSNETPNSTPSEPNSGSSTTTTHRGTATARTTRGPLLGRFRPKAIRRDQAERDALARQEEQKANERASTERRARGRSRFRSKRSRGDIMGSRGGLGRGISTASGPFSGGLAAAAGFTGGNYRGGGVVASSGTHGGFGSGSGRLLKSEVKTFGHDDPAHNREPRINADKLHVATPAEDLNSDDEATMAALSNRASSIMPMGIYRAEHKEAQVVVATTTELEATENAKDEEESLWVDGDGALSFMRQPEEQGVWDAKINRKVRVKTEPEGEGVDSMHLDSTDQLPLAQEKEEPEVARKAKKEIPLEPEEQLIQEDLELLANELGGTTISEGGVTRLGEPKNKDGRLYLFQFPPLLPPLKQVAVTLASKDGFKQEPDLSDNVNDAHVHQGDRSGSNSQLAVDLTSEGIGDKTDGTKADEDEDGDQHDGFRSQRLARGGMVGRLNVRRSGRTELDWGGMTLQMGPTAGMNFLTTAVIIDEGDEPAQAGVLGSEAFGMGKIMGRFTLAPAWDEEEMWMVDEDQLQL